jgi:uracil-DNA glycosylase
MNLDFATKGVKNYSFLLRDSSEGSVLEEGVQDFSTDLTRWAEQGVLLLNSVLTVEAKKAGSHKNLGWQQLTDEIVEQLSAQRENLVFLLWGAYAQSKQPLIDKDKHLILEAAHPSPFSAHRGFLGCKHFSKANAYLKQHQIEPIKW